MLGREPRAIAIRDHAPARRELARWAEGYDVVWCCRAESLVAVASLLDAPVVVDLDDLEAEKIRGARHVAGRGGLQPGAVLRSQAMRWDARGWERLQRGAVERSRVAVVASNTDRLRLGLRDVAVVPNVYPGPEVPAGSVNVGPDPTISFVGLLTYPPNADALRQLAHEIVPRVHDQDPSVRFRVIGRYQDDLARDCPTLSFVGEVDDVAPELARADVIAVPLRFGSGTRVKILEAFAHRVPVVSTHAGADGLPVQDGEQLLLADDPNEFSNACVRLLHDVELRRHLTTRAHHLWAEQHSPVAFQRSINEVIDRAVRPDGEDLTVVGSAASMLLRAGTT
jgi:glycosyltransferase involved in cell wall biosynthesis